jgi:hypothetical protein
MLDCSAREGVKCDPKSDERHKPICGSDLAFPYFISFYVLCSFLVGEPVLYGKDVHKILDFPLVIFPFSWWGVRLYLCEFTIYSWPLDFR